MLALHGTRQQVIRIRVMQSNEFRGCSMLADSPKDGFHDLANSTTKRKRLAMAP